MLCAPESIPDSDVERNICRVDGKGHLIWRILVGSGIYPRTPFTGIGFDEQNRLLAYRWDGTDYLIDLDSGEAKPLRLSR